MGRSGGTARPLTHFFTWSTLSSKKDTLGARRHRSKTESRMCSSYSQTYVLLDNTAYNVPEITVLIYFIIMHIAKLYCSLIFSVFICKIFKVTSFKILSWHLCHS